MRKIYTIDTSNFEQDQLHFSLNDNEVNLQLKPAGQLIADSDDFAFIYLLDAVKTIITCVFHRVVGRILYIFYKRKNPLLRIGEEVIELTNFYEELEMLVYNIEGNYNYGAEFVQAVEQHFKAILAE